MDDEPSIDRDDTDGDHWRHEAEKWKALSRKNEAAWHEALREIDELRDALADRDRRRCGDR